LGVAILVLDALLTGVEGFSYRAALVEAGEEAEREARYVPLYRVVHGSSSFIGRGDYYSVVGVAYVVYEWSGIASFDYEARGGSQHLIYPNCSFAVRDMLLGHWASVPSSIILSQCCSVESSLVAGVPKKEFFFCSSAPHMRHGKQCLEGMTRRNSAQTGNLGNTSVPLQLLMYNSAVTGGDTSMLSQQIQ